jgi:seryl-tRNA synthetase
MFASKSVFLKEEHEELEQELLGFKEHGTSTKDTLDALRWSMDDIYAPTLEQGKDGDWNTEPAIVGQDWETGEVFYA